MGQQITQIRALASYGRVVYSLQLPNKQHMAIAGHGHHKENEDIIVTCHTILSGLQLPCVFLSDQYHLALVLQVHPPSIKVGVITLHPIKRLRLPALSIRYTHAHHTVITTTL